LFLRDLCAFVTSVVTPKARDKRTLPFSRS
jgi:hypothetical protein